MTEPYGTVRCSQAKCLGRDCVGWVGVVRVLTRAFAGLDGSDGVKCLSQRGASLIRRRVPFAFAEPVD